MLEELPGSFGPVSEAEVEQVIAQMDQDGDGVVTEADFNGYVDTTAPEDDVLQHVEATAAEEACRRAGSRPGKWPTGTTMAEKRRDMFAAVDQVCRRADIAVSRPGRHMPCLSHSHGRMVTESSVLRRCDKCWRSCLGLSVRFPRQRWSK